MNNGFIIAIDGPSASGKSTVAKLVAQKLGINYADSGSMYRAITWRALEDDIDILNSEQLRLYIKKRKIEIFLRDKILLYKIDGFEPTSEIREQRVNDSVSKIASLAEARDLVTKKLRDMTAFGSLIMDGRDIGTVVFPNAEYKFYLDASPEERARRRYMELKDKESVDLNQISSSLKNRDLKDSSRDTAPLKIADDAIAIDTTGMTPVEVADNIIKIIQDNKRAKLNQA